MKVSLPRIFFLAGMPLAVGNVRAETINWYNTPNKTNLTSTGQAMDGAFQFQLGVFTGGFIPTAGNASQWAGHWIAAQSDFYDPSIKGYDSLFTVTGNSAPFSVGSKAYVWGRAVSAAKDEWILFRKSDWTWPAPNPMNPFYTDWNAATANEIILGTINSGGTPFLMKSEAVYSYAQWRDDKLAGESLNAPNDDPDHDGVSNLLEFVFGTSPVQSAAPPATPASFSGNYLQISIPRLRNRLATVIVEVSSDLTTWNSGETHTTEISSTVDTLVVRDKTSTGPGLPKRFMRMKAVIQP